MPCRKTFVYATGRDLSYAEKVELDRIVEQFA